MERWEGDVPCRGFKVFMTDRLGSALAKYLEMTARKRPFLGGDGLETLSMTVLPSVRMQPDGERAQLKACRGKSGDGRRHGKNDSKAQSGGGKQVPGSCSRGMAPWVPKMSSALTQNLFSPSVRPGARKKPAAPKPSEPAGAVEDGPAISRRGTPEEPEKGFSAHLPPSQAL